MRWLAPLAAAALLAGCNGGGDDESAPATTATQTVTVRESTPTETAAAPDRAGSLAAAVTRVLPSVVNVQTSSFGGGKGEASGVILRRDGLILTNNHVVEGTTGITVSFNDGVHTKPLKGTVIGTAPERDLAVVRVKANDLVPVALARSSALRLGDVVIAIGFPAGLGGPTVTSGIVSGLDRTIEGPNGDLTGLLQTDAAINPGNSGGPLVDRSGRLVGINTAGIRNADTENIGFAIAIDEALPVIAQISDEPPDDGQVARDRVQLGRLRDGGRPARARLVDPRRRRDGRLSRWARRQGGHGGRRRDHRRRRRPDPERERADEADRADGRSATSSISS